MKKRKLMKAIKRLTYAVQSLSLRVAIQARRARRPVARKRPSLK